MTDYHDHRRESLGSVQPQPFHRETEREYTLRHYDGKYALKFLPRVFLGALAVGVVIKFAGEHLQPAAEAVMRGIDWASQPIQPVLNNPETRTHLGLGAAVVGVLSCVAVELWRESRPIIEEEPPLLPSQETTPLSSESDQPL